MPAWARALRALRLFPTDFSMRTVGTLIRTMRTTRQSQQESHRVVNPRTLAKVAVKTSAAA